MTTSNAAQTFALAIKDAENLVDHFDKLNTKPPPPELEVLKRAGLITAMTAWETYVEDRLLEISTTRLAALNDSSLADFVRSRLDEEIKRLHNPSNAFSTAVICETKSGKWCLDARLLLI